jgi:ATP-binding cassette, subfamily F, member 3
VAGACAWRWRPSCSPSPICLLLDEPTNYLDLEGTMWLENYLAKYPHTVLLISHDRDLLNRAVDSIVHLEAKKLTFWRGGYDQFERQRAEKMELLQKSAAKQDAKRKHMQAFVDRFRYKASKARQAQSRLKALEKMAPVAPLSTNTCSPSPFRNPRSRSPHPLWRWRRQPSATNRASRS